MAFFFDTSALVKRYDQAEAGSRRPLELCDPAAGHLIFVASLTSVEMAAALNRKQREGRLSSGQRDRFWAAFRIHLEDQYRVVDWDEELRLAAIDLLFAHPLRAYDAVHLAAALRMRALLLPRAEELVFCSADRTQARAAADEGLKVELIGATT